MLMIHIYILFTESETVKLPYEVQNTSTLLNTSQVFTRELIYIWLRLWSIGLGTNDTLMAETEPLSWNKTQ